MIHIIPILPTSWILIHSSAFVFEGLMNRRSLEDPVYDNKPTRRPPITLKTLLNKVHRIKSFIYDSVKLSGTGDSMRIIANRLHPHLCLW